MPLEPNTQYEIELREVSQKKAGTKVADPDQLEAANKKLGLYEQCSRAVAAKLMESRTMFLRSVPQTLRADNLPGIIAIMATVPKRAR